MSILGNRTEILYNTVSYSYIGIKYIYNYLYQNDIQSNLQNCIKMIINDEFMIKLKLVENWLKIYDPNKDANKKIVYDMINNNCKVITNTINIIENKINEHNKKWLNNWRSVDISEEIKLLKESIQNLDNNIAYIF
jgi:hypothetical protein